MKTKLCNKCKIEYPLTKEYFYERGGKSIEFRENCKQCTLKQNKIYSKNWKRRQSNKMYWGAYIRAKNANIKFSIKETDINIPILCPLLGIELKPGKGKTSKHSPTIDRIDNTKGYTMDNIWVISHLANNMKRNSSKEELILFANNILKHIDDIV